MEKDPLFDRCDDEGLSHNGRREVALKRMQAIERYNFLDVATAFKVSLNLNCVLCWMS